MLNKSKWIWQESEYEKNVFCDFSEKFNFGGKKATIKISVDTTYAVYVNGKFAALGQYPDYPHYKIYDEIDITEYCNNGENNLSMVVWGLGEISTTTHYPGKPALRYEVFVDGELITYSSEKTQSRLSRVFDSSFDKNFSSHLPYTMHCDLSKEDNWMQGELDGFKNSVVIEQEFNMYPRPISKTVISKEPIKATRLDIKENVIYDLGREETGYIGFSINSPIEQKITIGIGEYIRNGDHIHYLLDDYGKGSRGRQFGFDFTLKKGKNVFFNPLFRVGIRYLQIDAQCDLDIEYIGMYTSYYKLDKKPFELSDELDRKIYDVCLHTLECCMHEHYEDCPTREQALYALDSRNQMLCGYYAFGEYKFPRSNLMLFGKDIREDKLLTITAPRKVKLTISTFALFYIIETFEYVTYSKDLSIIEETYDKMQGIFDAFIGRMDGGLVPNFTEKHIWNFYEWREGMEGKLDHEDDYKFDTPMNCIFVLALKAMHRMNQMVGKTDNYLELADSINKEIYNRLYDKERKVFLNSTMDSNSAELSNAFAILCGAIEGDEAKALAEKLADKDNGLTLISLSMIGFKYDALVKACGDKYNDYILENIRKTYKFMLDNDATTFWEYDDTLERIAKEGGASSFCHGWSAMPVYYYHTLGRDIDIVKYYD